MNNVIKLGGKHFMQASRQGGGGSISMNGQKKVTCSEIRKIKEDISRLIRFWRDETRPFGGALVSVRYNKIVAKSNRISGLLKGRETSKAVVGAKYNDSKNAHIITYYVDVEDLEKSVKLLDTTGDILRTAFNGCIDKPTFESGPYNKSIFRYQPISKSLFKQVIADVSYIDGFEIPGEYDEVHEFSNGGAVSLYDVKVDIVSLLSKVGVEDVFRGRVIDSNTVSLTSDQLKMLQSRAPYLIAMAASDETKLSFDDYDAYEDGYHEATNKYIPKPKNEPTIGVIDKLFDDRVYFRDWVEYHDMVDDDIPKCADDYVHGTAVSSIIVDGPSLNPDLDDGCGRFRVRHFGVATGDHFSSSSVIKQIEQIVLNNRDIRVWNLSLGSDLEISDNSASVEAAIIDKLQYEYDIIFIVAGTNDFKYSHKKIGSPADSINSLVVNAVESDGTPARYGRVGPALSFFVKPDVSYYGCSKVCRPTTTARANGTSFAAPWVARKLAYLINILGIDREVAKAMIIDAAASWSTNNCADSLRLGYGIVPIHIDKIVKSNNDEIKFVVSDRSIKWNTYEYHFPVPMKNSKYPYLAKVTMCYFPSCARSQGVDYTNTELNIHFGRIDDSGRIRDIRGDRQNQDDFGVYIYEDEARKNFRKWDNVKVCVERVSSRARPRISYGNENWGMEIKTANRIDPSDGDGLRFGVVVTLKEINGVNRFDEFVRKCTLNGWLVSDIDIPSRVEINEKVNEYIEVE